MLEFVTKEKYWQLLDQGIDEQLAPAEFPWHLKSVQDVLAYHYLGNPSGEVIGEVGGGDSRLLPVLRKANRCFNIEKFEGRDGGPGSEIKLRGVRNVHAFVGEFSNDLADSSFDALVSVSVVEHIPNDQMIDFIRDCHRILKPGGRMIHLVDMYLAETRLAYNASRISLYEAAFKDQLFEPMDEQRIRGREDLSFRGSYCTNPDNVMYLWNQVNADLRDLRENSQSVAISWGGTAL